jgi:predicted TIM-barrel fold metal-dependent hydrolase
MSRFDEILSLAETTPFVDTHEHLLEEQTRLAGPAGAAQPSRALKDFAVLFSHYADSDLLAAGMSQADYGRFFSPDVDPREKWRLLAPWYERSRLTGYMRNVRESLRILYGEEDLAADNVERVSRKVADMIRPGYYRRVLLEASRLSYCQVNSLEAPLFMETAQPDLLAQDLSIVALSTDLDGFVAARRAGREARTLADWHRVIDWAFATWGPRAIAVKSQAAYQRRLDYDDVSAEDAAPLFSRFAAAAPSLSAAELKALQDHLFNRCLRKAAESRLPVKLHTGTYAGVSRMPLHRVRANAGDVSELLMRHPDVRFVVMHIDWPYQDEAIALAKHFPNAWVDMCWAWIISPAAATRFLREFLVTAPASKLLGFGGDYMPVELVPGHARIARMGIARALAGLEEAGDLAPRDTPALLARIMHGNADELFDRERALSHA